MLLVLKNCRLKFSNMQFKSEEHFGNYNKICFYIKKFSQKAGLFDLTINVCHPGPGTCRVAWSGKPASGAADEP